MLFFSLDDDVVSCNFDDDWNSWCEYRVARDGVYAASVSDVYWRRETMATTTGGGNTGPLADHTWGNETGKAIEYHLIDITMLTLKNPIISDLFIKFYRQSWRLWLFQTLSVCLCLSVSL